jgi:dihydrolipoamide dehydrogenase
MGKGEVFDLCVIGAGPGGYVACVRAAQLGLKVVCVEKEPRLGGVCLNIGCIPSKALLDSSEYYYLAISRVAEHGILIDSMRLDLPAMMARKDRVVRDLSDNIRKLLEGNRIKIVQGSARLVDRDKVEVTHGGSGNLGIDPTIIEARSILLATGSEPVSLPGIPFDGSRIVSSTEALAFASVPEHLAIVGGGYIGLELGSVWRRLGSKVTVIEMLPTIASSLDGQIRRAFERSLAKQGFTFRLQTRVLAARVETDGVELAVEVKGREEAISCDRLLVAVGRRPLTRGLGLEEAGVKVDPVTGRLWVDAYYRTTVPSILAVGDLIAGPMLAHKASAEGIAAVEGIAGLPGEVNYDAIPAVVYTSPEVAGVGLTEEQVHARGIEHNVGTYPFAGAGRARCMGETEGLVKIITHGRTDRILGVHIFGPRASDLIGEGVLAIECNLTSREFARVLHGHPTFSEALHEAALAVKKCSIYAS